MKGGSQDAGTRAGRAAAWGIGLGLLAPLLWSSSALLVKVLPFAPIPLVGWRALLAVLALAPFWRPRRLAFSWALAVLLAAYTLSPLCYVTAVRWTTAANAIALQSTAPAWVLAFTWIAERRVRWPLVAPVVLVLAGVAVMLSEPAGAALAQVSGGGGRPAEGNLVALAGGVAFGLFTFTLPRVPQPAVSRVALCNLTAAAAMFLLSPAAFLDLRPTPVEWAALVFLGTVQIGLATVCFAAAMTRISPGQASVLSLLEPLLSPLWVFLAIGERPSAYGLAGGACILAGIVSDLAVRWRLRLA